jgi:hypothetical protein
MSVTIDKIADRETIREYADRAYSLLYQSGHDEFGEATRMAICDLAGDTLTEDGYRYSRATLVELAELMA